MTDISGAAGTPAAGAPSTAATAIGAAAAGAASDLPRKAADAVQLVVDTIHDKAVRPAVLAARALVFGLIVAALATLFVVVASIAVLRLLDVYAFGHRVWLSYVVLGGLLTVMGLGAWTRRTVRRPSAR